MFLFIKFKFNLQFIFDLFILLIIISFNNLNLLYLLKGDIRAKHKIS